MIPVVGKSGRRCCGGGVCLVLRSPVRQADNVLPLLVPLVFAVYQSTLRAHTICVNIAIVRIEFNVPVLAPTQYAGWISFRGSFKTQSLHSY